MSSDCPTHPDWAQLLFDAVTQPGVVSVAYSRFWNYSVGNQILAMIQCMIRGIEAGPIHTFKGWQELGRHVKKGEKAITLCMPVRLKRSRPEQLPASELIRSGDGAERQMTGPDGAIEDDGARSFTVFTYKPRWFVLSQTQGDDYVPTEMPAWSEANALHVLMIERARFTHSNGNCQGYAIDRSVAVSPIAALPHKTLFHEIAHIVLGHTEEGHVMDDHELTPTNLREVEAECVALICCESLGVSGVVQCRGYIQNWLGKEKVPDRSAQRIFKAADTILKAGYPAIAGNPAETSD